MRDFLPDIIPGMIGNIKYKIMEENTKYYEVYEENLQRERFSKCAQASECLTEPSLHLRT